jgi:hypothetical protein
VFLKKTLVVLVKRNFGRRKRRNESFMKEVLVWIGLPKEEIIDNLTWGRYSLVVLHEKELSRYKYIIVK